MLKIQIILRKCKLGNALNANEGMSMHVNEEMLAAKTDADALVILMLILIQLNLNRGYTDTDLCIRIMSLCCTSIRLKYIQVDFKTNKDIN